MPIFEAWAVVVVPFPFVDRRQAKRRPAIVLSPKAFQASHACTVLGMITDARNPRWPSDVLLVDPEAAGLRFPSMFRCKLFTLDIRLILSSVGHLSLPDRRAARRALRSALAAA